MKREEAIKIATGLRTNFKCESDTMVDFCDTIIKALEQCEDVMAIHTQGLDEGIRCAMCTNSLKSDRGCDGGCVVNENMYKEVMNTIENHIVLPVTPTSSKMEQVEWVSVNESMPEEQVEVLVTREFPDGKGGTIRVLEIASFGAERWSDSKCWITNDFRRYPTEEIVAWMPLPTAYVESEEK